MSRASYTRARRKGETADNRTTNALVDAGKLPESQRENVPQSAKSKLRPALEKIAKKVHKVAKPAVTAVKKATVAGVKQYLKGTDAVAAKLKPALMKLPKGKSRPRPRVRKRM